MKKICLSVLIILFSMCMLVPPLAANAATIDDVYDKIATEGTDMDYQIWNYINNALMPEIQASNGGVSQESIDNVQNSINNVQNSVNSIDVKKDMEDFFNEKNANQKNDDVHPANSFTDKILDAVEEMWGLIPDYCNLSCKIQKR